MRHTPHGAIERSNIWAANAEIIIGENVWIGSDVRICKGVKIGDNAIIAACSVVTKDVPANSIAAGNPARIVKEEYDINTTSINMEGQGLSEAAPPIFIQNKPTQNIH